MARYQYIGAEEERGFIPSWGFDDGVLEPGHLASLIERGQVRDLAVLRPSEPERERPVHAAAPERKPKARARKAR